MAVELCVLASGGIWTGIGILVSLLLLALALFHSGKNTTWIKQPSLALLLVTTVLVVWQYLGCQKFSFAQIGVLVVLEGYLMLALMHQHD